MGGYEHFLQYNQGLVEKEEFSLTLSDETGTFAQLEKRDAHGMRTRYQHSDHLGGSHLETEEHGTVISYEEYHPFGTTAYQATLNLLPFGAKRYRYCGKERDEESGLNYYGARYYASWLGRFVSVDPKESKYFFQSSYAYAENSPVTKMDWNGEGSEEKKPKSAPVLAPPVMPKAPGDPTVSKNDNTVVNKGPKPILKKEENLLDLFSKPPKVMEPRLEIKPGKPFSQSKAEKPNPIVETVKSLINKLDNNQQGGAINYRSPGGPHEKIGSAVDFPKGDLKEPPIVIEGPISNGLLGQDPISRIPKDFNPFGVMKAMYEFKKAMADLSEQLFSFAEELNKLPSNNQESEENAKSTNSSQNPVNSEKSNEPEKQPEPKAIGLDTIFNPITENTTIFNDGKPTSVQLLKKTQL